MLDKDEEDQLEKGVLKRVQGEGNILHITKRTKAKWIGHIFCRNWLLKHVIFRKIEKRIEVTGKRERRRKQILDGFKAKRGKLKLKEAALDRTLWGNVFGRGKGAVLRLIKEWWYYCVYYFLSVEHFIYISFLYFLGILRLTLHVYF